jgi:hypothetical protein
MNLSFLKVIAMGQLTRFSFIAIALALSIPAFAQEGDAPAPYAYNEGLARELKEIVWSDANKMSWRHWSDANGVKIFHDNNNGRMRDVHMNHIRGNPNADNMMVAGPGFYIASDVKLSAYFGEELLDVCLSKKIYKGERRDGALNPQSSADQWGFLGANPGATGDPMGGRSDFLARLSRRSTRKEFEGRFFANTGNRLQSYEDEGAIFALGAAVTKDKALKKALTEWSQRAGALKNHERALVLGEGPLAGRALESEGLGVEKDSLGLVRALSKAWADGRRN